MDLSGLKRLKSMIKFTDNDVAIQNALNSDSEYQDFVKNGCARGYILIQVENGSVVLFHNIDDTFSSFLLPDEIWYYANHIDDIRRIANTIQNKANTDYKP